MTNAQLSFDDLITHEIHDLVERDNGPFPLCAEQKAILRILNEYRGQARPIPLRVLRDQVSAAMDKPISRRRVEDYVRSLVVEFGVRIGSSRGKNHGYYLIRTAEELEKTLAIYVGEMRQLGRRVRVLKGKEFVAELFGQMALQENTERA